MAVTPDLNQAVYQWFDPLSPGGPPVGSISFYIHDLQDPSSEYHLLNPHTALASKCKCTLTSLLPLATPLTFSSTSNRVPQMPG